MGAKTVGILGGMGPDATVDLMARVIRTTPAEDDADHIRMLVDNNPKVPSRIKAIIEGSGESPAPCLAAMAQGLEKQGADFLVMPCNTVAFPCVNLIDLTVAAAIEILANLKKVGLLASTAVQLTGLYGQRFEAKGVEAIFPVEELQGHVMQLIRKIKSDTADDKDIHAMNRAAEQLEGEGAQSLIIACTELSVVSGLLHTNLPFLDTSQLLAEYVVKNAG